MALQLTDILAEVKEKNRNSTTGALDDTKRTRAINRILGDLQDFADWEFTKRNKIFYFIDGVSEYSLENHVDTTCQDNDGSTSISDFKNPHDIRPDGDKSLDYKEAKAVRENIRRNKFIKEYAIDGDTLILGYPRQISAQLHNCDSLTANGTWAASGDASNLIIDTQEYEEGNGALNFDSAGTSLILTNSTLSSKDLTSLQNKSHITIKVELPSIANFTSIAIRWGSSASAYWEKTETLPAASQALKVGRNTFAFRWADATETGSPDVSAVNYMRIVLTYSASLIDTDFRVDDIRIGKEVEMNLDYFSLAMVKDAAGDYQLEFNPDSVTMTDTLLGDARRCVVQGSVYELYEILGGKSERDRTDSFKLYEQTRMNLFKRSGHRLRRSSRVLNFAR